MKSLKQAVIFLLCLLHDDYAITLNLLCLVIMIIIYGEPGGKMLPVVEILIFWMCTSSQQTCLLGYVITGGRDFIALASRKHHSYFFIQRSMLLPLSHLLKIVLKAIISVWLLKSTSIVAKIYIMEKENNALLV